MKKPGIGPGFFAQVLLIGDQFGLTSCVEPDWVPEVV